MFRTSARLVALLVAFALVAAACGGSRESDETADPTTSPSDGGTGDEGAGDDGGEDGAPADDDAGGADEPAGDGDAGDDADGGPPDTDVAMFGDMEWPCGPGDASGATDQGVTDDTILIGGGDDRGFATSLGLNKAQTDAIQALVERCNELGGINGRTIEVEPYDAKLFEVSAVMLDACDRVFMLVGEGFAVDQFGEETRVQCGLAHIPAWTVSASAAHGPFTVQPVPNPADRLNTHQAAWLAEAFPDAIGKSATVFGNFGATIEPKDKVLAAYPSYGFEFDQNLEFNLNGEDDWTPFVLALKDAGIEHVYFSGACLPHYQAFRAAAAVNEFDAVYSADTVMYEAACAAANADGVMDDTYVRVVYYPLEEREVVPAVDDYATLVEEWGGELSALGMQTTTAFMLWAKAASACGSELTRDCVLAEAAAIDDWTGGGLHVPTDPGSLDPPACGMVLRLAGPAYERAFPEEPGTTACDDGWVAEISTEWSVAANLDADRISQQYTG